MKNTLLKKQGAPKARKSPVNARITPAKKNNIASKAKAEYAKAKAKKDKAFNASQWHTMEAALVAACKSAEKTFFVIAKAKAKMDLAPKPKDWLGWPAWCSKHGVAMSTLQNATAHAQLLCDGVTTEVVSRLSVGAAKALIAGVKAKAGKGADKAKRLEASKAILAKVDKGGPLGIGELSKALGKAPKAKGGNLSNGSKGDEGETVYEEPAPTMESIFAKLDLAMKDAAKVDWTEAGLASLRAHLEDFAKWHAKEAKRIKPGKLEAASSAAETTAPTA